MAAGDAVDPIRQDEAHPRGPGHPREEGGEAARPGVGMVQILEDEQDRPVLAGALEQPLDRLRDPRGTPLGRDRFAAGVRNLTGEPRRDSGDEAGDRLGAGTGGARQLRVVEAGEPRREALDDRAVGGAAARRHGGAPDHLERLAQAADAAHRLGHQAANARSAAAGQQQSRAPPVGGSLERHGEMRQLSLAPDEPLAAEPRGHEPIVPHGTSGLTLDRVTDTCDPGGAADPRRPDAPRRAAARYSPAE